MPRRARSRVSRESGIPREPDRIVVEGAHEHNLQVDQLELPKHRLVVITGPSGSGKSSLAFDTLYAEGQRRYVESLSAYARQFLGQMEKPKYERIRGLSPTIAIQQKSASSNPRSTVGTITEIYDYLRVLYARAGEQRCHQCGGPVGARTAGEVVDELAELPDKTQVTVIAPKAENRKGEFRELFGELRKAGFVRVRIDGMIVRLEDVGSLEKKKKHSIELVVDRVVINSKDRGRLTDSVETALREGKGKLIVEVAGEKVPRVYSESNACPKCGIGFPELSPQSFSFNSPLGMCVECNGLGERMAADPDLVIPDPTRSIRDGGVAVWGDSIAKESGWTSNIVKALAKAFKIDLDKPWNKLSQKQRDVLLYGTGDKRVSVSWEGRHSTGEWAMRFEGILAQLERRHRESSSERTRAHYEQFFNAIPCAVCEGTRLRPESRAVLVSERAIVEVTDMTVGQAFEFITGMKLTGSRALIAGEVLKEIRNRLTFLLDVGLDYLTLHRSAATLSGGEAQRIRLASQLGSELSGVLYVLDEPSIGLHQRDNERLIKTLHRLRDLGNTVLVVEHDEATIEAADWVVDFGPGAGRHGGHVVAEGTPDDIRKAADVSTTGRFLAGIERIEVPATRREASSWVKLTGAREHNLRNVSVEIPLGVMVAVTGVSGAGKSSLINGTLFPALSRMLHRSLNRVGAYDTLTGLGQIDKCIVIDQQPIGRTPRSNAATYTKAFDQIRELYSQVPQAQDLRLRPGPVLVQRVGQARRWAVRGVRGRRRARGRDALLAQRVRHLRGVQGQALQRRHAARDLQGQEHRRDPRHAGRGGLRDVQAPSQARPDHEDDGRCRARLPRARTVGDHALGWRGPARQARPRARPRADRAHAVPARRADHRPPLRRRQEAARGAAAPGRRRQHRAGDRAQPRRHQERGLDHRPRPRGRCRRRRGDRGGHARAGRGGTAQLHRPVPQAVAQTVAPPGAARRASRRRPPP